MEIPANEMMPVPIEELVNGVKTPCELYVRIGNDHFVMVANAGSPTHVEQLSNYQSKSVEYLWVHKKDYYKMAHQTTSLAGAIVPRRDIGSVKKTELLTKAASTAFRQIDSLGLDTNTFGTARAVSEAVFTLVDSHPSLSELLESLKKSSDQLLAHSMAVSILSTIIGQSMGFTKKMTLEKLALAGLLHDIGLKTLPPELLKKSLAQMTGEEIMKWQTHPYRGMELLQTLGVVPDDVISMVFEHHENSVGQGFPQMIRDVKLHPLGKITALAEQFCELTLPGVNTPIPKSAREAVMYIEHTMKLPFNKEVFRALKRVVENEKAAA